MSTNLGNREKEKVSWQASEAQREKELQRDRKNKGDIFCWRNKMKFCSGGEKMRNANGNQGENERQWKKKKVNKNMYEISSVKRVTRKFHVVVVQNNGKEMYKKVCCTCKVAFLLIRPIVVFSPFSLPSLLAEHYMILHYVWANYKYYRELRF